MKILGYDEAFNTCDCCGKTNLKGTFTVETEAGDYLHYGCVCVTRHTGKPSKQVRQEAKDATELRKTAARKEMESHPTWVAYQAKMQEARKLGLIGLTFRNHCTKEREAQNAAQQEIADRAGLKFHDIY